MERANPRGAHALADWDLASGQRGVILRNGSHRRHRPRHDPFAHRRHGRRVSHFACGSRGETADPFGGSFPGGGRTARRRGGQPDAGGGPGGDRGLDQTLHGAARGRGGGIRSSGRVLALLPARGAARHAGARGGARARDFPGGDLGVDSREAQTRRGGGAGAGGDAGGRDRARVLQRRAARRDGQGGGTRRAESGADCQRTDRRGACLRPRQARRAREGGGVRPRRRHVRSLDPGAFRRRLSGAGHAREHAPGR